VLRQLIEDSEAFSQVARQALAFCHFDPDTGEDLGHAEGAKEDCEAACYDCLLSYYNQRDHPLLNRHLIKNLLLRYADSNIIASPESVPRGEHYQNLYNLCESDLERKWLDYIEVNGYRIPTDAQAFIEPCHTRPDFIYEDEHVVIYVDGYHHLYSDRRQRDAHNTECLENLGFTVLRFGLLEAWEQIFSSNTYVFGKKS
jgi:very-short-patch-repair endonuclease